LKPKWAEPTTNTQNHNGSRKQGSGKPRASHFQLSTSSDSTSSDVSAASRSLSPPAQVSPVAWRSPSPRLLSLASLTTSPATPTVGRDAHHARPQSSRALQESFQGIPSPYKVRDLFFCPTSNLTLVTPVSSFISTLILTPLHLLLEFSHYALSPTTRRLHPRKEGQRRPRQSSMQQSAVCSMTMKMRSQGRLQSILATLFMRMCGRRLMRRVQHLIHRIHR
jgi:hypothetical protein